MRKVIDMQIKFGEMAIANIQFDPHSRDEIPKLFRGLQSIWCNREIRDQVFDALKGIIPENVNPKNGRNGIGECQGSCHLNRRLSSFFLNDESWRRHLLLQGSTRPDAQGSNHVYFLTID